MFHEGRKETYQRNLNNVVSVRKHPSAGIADGYGTREARIGGNEILRIEK